jgi:hypothetical protein
MTVEDRLKQVLHGEASQVDSPAEWTDVERGLAARRRTRRFRQAALSTVAAAAMVAGVLAVVSADDDGSSLRVVPPATQPTVAPTSTPASTATVPPSTTTIPSSDAPDRIVVARQDDRETWLEVLDASSGRKLRDLARRGRDAEAARSITSVAMSGDGKTVYYDVSDEGGVSDVFRAPLSGGTPELVKHDGGNALTLSPDGRLLGYISLSRSGIATLDLTTGAERFWRFGSENEIYPHSLAFTSDSKGIVFAHSCCEHASQLRLLDLSATSLNASRTIGPPDGLPNGTGWFEPSVRLHDGLITTIEDCCALDAGTYDGATSIVVLDASGAVRGRTRLDTSRLNEMASDRTGQHLLFLSCEASGCRLSRLGDGDTFRTMADGVRAADW